MYLKQWRRPRQYRSVIAYNPRGIYQVDIMYLTQLWDYIYSKEARPYYDLNNYAVVCVDVYSRFAMAVSIPTRQQKNIRTTLIQIVKELGKPDWISADNEIIDSLFVNHVLDPFFVNIKLYRTSPDEINKNAIVERMIRTIKWYILKILMNFEPGQILDHFRKQGVTWNFTDILLYFACRLINGKVNRTIKAIPEEVFVGLVGSNQKIVKKDFLLLPIDTIVLKIPERLHSQVPIKTFDYDVEPYIIVGHSGMKYYIQRLVDRVQERPLQIFNIRGRLKQPKLYKEYELKPFKDYREAYEFLQAPLVKMKLWNIAVKKGNVYEYIYRNGNYEKMLQWIKVNG
jgi:hypothetical protein